jgi:hypothetical protein
MGAIGGEGEGEDWPDVVQAGRQMDFGVCSSTEEEL